MSNWHWRELMFGRCKLIALTGCMVLASVSTAYADQIDGEWCNPKDGQNLEIQGSSIITPSGTATEGDYTRHGFSYVIPPTDPGAGGEISMRQLSDDLMLLTPPEGGEQEWRRCRLQTS